ncbi:clostripain-related cysteine peptidase [Rhizobium mongolense]|uniref:Cysteine peptidase C11 family protein n=2 Tax=Rhizobium mongolense TaxID=57676 RepID=A0ABR6IXJ9_9HYPH|nr:clostripain-related cysteine peptidase [Rhizobium mongolense]MBB4232622.1 hypothetical protein [Rhizobium mongolense]TVZ74843.1 cysteine peptidase C11 family protein [Rhizobium mongolense USDA 1844]
MANIAEWTVMVFLNADNNLEQFGLKDFREMAKVGSDSNVNIVVQFDRNGGWATTTPQWRGCYRFKIGKGSSYTPAEALEYLGDTNMGSGITLRNFVDWATTKYPAKKYMLAIWNHGQGWRHFRTIRPNVSGLELSTFRQFRESRMVREAERQARTLSRREGLSDQTPVLRTQAIPLDVTVNGSVRSVSSDDTSGDTLYNREIQESLNGLNFDVIGFDACLMGMVETGYALRNVAKVMVGSEELEPGDGWNYAGWLQSLVDNPEMSGADLGTTMVRSYEDYYSGPGDDPATTLSAIDLSTMQNLATTIDGFANTLTNVSNADFGRIVSARRSCEEYAPGYGLHGVDLARFAEQAGAAFPNTDVGQAADAVFEAVRASVIANYAGAERQGAFGSHGLAIYFPETRANFNADPDHVGYIKTNAHYPVEFVQNHLWADFLLNRYLAGVTT